MKNIIVLVGTLVAVAALGVGLIYRVVSDANSRFDLCADALKDATSLVKIRTEERDSARANFIDAAGLLEKRRKERDAAVELYDRLQLRINALEDRLQATIDANGEERAKCVYIVSHNPMGGPWVLEKWWHEEELWVPIQAYHNRISAFDVRERLERSALRAVELLR